MENAQFILEKEWPAKPAERNDVWLRHLEVERLCLPDSQGRAFLTPPRPSLFSRKQSNLVGHPQV